jgi:hypothetical protein
MCNAGFEIDGRRRARLVPSNIYISIYRLGVDPINRIPMTRRERFSYRLSPFVPSIMRATWGSKGIPSHGTPGRDTDPSCVADLVREQRLYLPPSLPTVELRERRKRGKEDSVRLPPVNHRPASAVLIFDNSIIAHYARGCVGALAPHSPPPPARRARESYRPGLWGREGSSRNQ